MKWQRSDQKTKVGVLTLYGKDVTERTVFHSLRTKWLQHKPPKILRTRFTDTFMGLYLSLVYHEKRSCYLTILMTSFARSCSASYDK